MRQSGSHLILRRNHRTHLHSNPNKLTSKCPKMPTTTAHPQQVIPLLSAEQMERILSSRRSITSAEFRSQVEAHLGRPLSPARRKVSVNGREVWVSN